MADNKEKPKEIDWQKKTLDDVSISNLINSNLSFYIPNYQRGYKWTKQQVNDLLNDINDFNSSNSEFYCLQPLVVKSRVQENNSYEVIDGQQRLTTIYLLLSYLYQNEVKALYKIEYETRSGSFNYLSKFKKYQSNSKYIKDTRKDNSDYYNMYNAFICIKSYFEESHKEIKKDDYRKKLEENVKFIWYKVGDKDKPIEVFTRLNIGKIPLNNSELIKALILNSSNFSDNSNLHQLQMALEWDNIEYALQTTDFWSFINNTTPSYNSTRINFIFDLIEKYDYLDIKKDINEDAVLGEDSYRTFRYVNYYLNKNKSNISSALKNFWQEVTKIFNIFNEWYNDIELYHYVGFIINTNSKRNIADLLNRWNENLYRDGFIQLLIQYIHEIISSTLDFTKVYELNEKRKLKPLLLLHNVETIVQQNNNYKHKYSDGAFVKFPFHLFKEEKWDIEHIDSNTPNDLKGDDLKDYLLSIYVTSDKENVKTKIKKMLKNEQDDQELDRNVQDLLVLINNSNNSKLSDNEKNTLLNFTLLDQSTNRSNGNAVFSMKRRAILGKDQGFKYTYNYDKLELNINESSSSFIPICTKNVFTKSYSVTPNDLSEWTKEDGENYLKDIESKLHKFINLK